MRQKRLLGSMCEGRGACREKMGRQRGGMMWEDDHLHGRKRDALSRTLVVGTATVDLKVGIGLLAIENLVWGSSAVGFTAGPILLLLLRLRRLRGRLQ